MVFGVIFYPAIANASPLTCYILPVPITTSAGYNTNTPPTFTISESGTITLDNIGFPSPANIADWSVTVSAGSDSFTFTPANSSWNVYNSNDIDANASIMAYYASYQQGWFYLTGSGGESFGFYDTWPGYGAFNGSMSAVFANGDTYNNPLPAGWIGTIAQTAPVPEPASLPLLGLGLVLAIGAKLRMDRDQASACKRTAREPF